MYSGCLLESFKVWFVIGHLGKWRKNFKVSWLVNCKYYDKTEQVTTLCLLIMRRSSFPRQHGHTWQVDIVGLIIFDLVQARLIVNKLIINKLPLLMLLGEKEQGGLGACEKGRKYDGHYMGTDPLSGVGGLSMYPSDSEKPEFHPLAFPRKVTFCWCQMGFQYHIHLQQNSF